MDPWGKLLLERKPVTSRTGPRQACNRRIVLLEHANGQPLKKPKLPPELARAVRKAAKKARRKQACQVFGPLDPIPQIP